MGSVSAQENQGNDPRLLIAACVTGGFMAVQALGGIATGSLVLLAAACLMLPNTTALALSCLSSYLAEGNAKFPQRYPWNRVRTLATYTVAIASFAIGIWIVVEAVRRMVVPHTVLAWPMLGLGALGVVVNGAVLFLLHGAGRDAHGPQGLVRHVTSDLFGAVAATVAALSMLVSGWLLIDTLLAVPVAVLILLGASVTLGDTGHRLLQGMPAGPDRDSIARDIKANVKGVLDVHHVHVWSHDGVHTRATLQAWLSEGADAHAAICDIKLWLAKHHRIEHVTVEPEFGHNAGRPAGTHLH